MPRVKIANHLNCFLIDRRKRVEQEAGVFDYGEKSLVGGQTESGNFHVRAHKENYESAVDNGQINVLQKRVNKIEEILETTIQY